MSIARQQSAFLNPDERLKKEFWNAVIQRTNGLGEKDHTLAFLMNEAASAIYRHQAPLTKDLIADICHQKYGKGDYSYGSLILPMLAGLHSDITSNRTILTKVA